MRLVVTDLALTAQLLEIRQIKHTAGVRRVLGDVLEVLDGELLAVLALGLLLILGLLLGCCDLTLLAQGVFGLLRAKGAIGGTFSGADFLLKKARAFLLCAIDSFLGAFNGGFFFEALALVLFGFFLFVFFLALFFEILSKFLHFGLALSWVGIDVSGDGCSAVDERGIALLACVS